MIMKNSIKSIFRSPPVLYTDRLTLRKLSKSDYCDMFEYSADKELTRYLTWEPHPDKNYTYKYLSYLQSRYRAYECFDWAIEYNGKMIGTCGFTALNEYSLYGEVGYVIAPKYQKMGIAPEAVRKVMEFGFNTLGLNRIEARFMIENTPSRKVMEKVGMTFEGILRESMYIKDRYVSVGICSILRSEYYN